MKYYLLTIIGNIESEKMCKEIALSLSPLVDSPNLKFQHKKGTLLFHFGTEVHKEEIYDYICGILYGMSDTFILTEINDNMSVSMPKEMIGHLFDLENLSDDVDMKLDMSRVVRNTDFVDVYDDDDDFDPSFSNEIDSKFLSTIKSHLDSITVKPTLDQILDKINSKGYNSLTPYEKDSLENYSKK
jgi:hypothetical protein